MTSCELPRIRVTNPGDLIETVPYLMGFHPSESLVLIGFVEAPRTGLQQVSVTMRIDLPTDGLVEELMLPLLDALDGSQTQAVVAVALTSRATGDPRRDPWLMAIAGQLRRQLPRHGLAVLDVLVATAGTWWSLCCQQSDCCPEQGTPRQPAGSTVAAQATYAGLVALPDRESLAATLAGAPDSERAAVKPALVRAENRASSIALTEGLARAQRTEIAALLRAARSAGADGARLSERQLARFAVALTGIEVRDALWSAIEVRRVPAEALLRDLHTRLPPPYDAAPLFLFGWAQWRAGNGTLARMAAERALESDPNYSAAALLISAVTRGLDPRSTPPLSVSKQVRRGA